MLTFLMLHFLICKAEKVLNLRLLGGLMEIMQTMLGILHYAEEEFSQ